MRTYRLILRPHGSWCTPWMADTLFGSLAWRLLRLAGEDELRRLIEEFSGAEPPFVLSDAFPEGWLPCPLSAELEKVSKGSNLKPKLPAWVREEQFKSLIRNSGKILPPQDPPQPVGAGSRLHVSIDRRAGTATGEGSSSLFEIPEWRLQKAGGSQPEHLVVYIRTGAWLDRLVTLFNCLSTTGFGKKKSSGRGAFEVAGEPQPCDWMDDNEGADGFVSLSHFVPAETDPTEGRWAVAVKYPKFAAGAPTPGPFKGRLTMLRPGSVFKIVGSVEPFYGRMLRGLHQVFPQSVQYGLAFAVPMRWAKTEDEGQK